MSNPTTGLFETLVAASNLATAAPIFTNAILDAVYSGYEPFYGGAVGQTIELIVPTVDTSTVSDIGAGAISLSNTDHTPVALTLAKKQSTSFRIQSFDQVRTPMALSELYVKPRLEALLRKVGADFISEINGTNFDVNATISGSGVKITRQNLADAAKHLFAEGCPMDDTANLFVLTSGGPYFDSIADQTFSYEYIVGLPAAVAAQQMGVIAPTLGARVLKDQNMPVASSVYTSLFFHRYAYGVRYAVEPPIDPEGGFIKETIIYPRENLPVKVQMWADGSNQGTIVHLSCVYGNKVVRPEFGNLITT